MPNLKWSFSDSKVRLFNGGWTREQVINDLPASHDISAAQLHLNKGAIRELHWHRTAEWGYVYAGRFIISAVTEEGKYEVDTLEVGDIWYFPKGQAHSIQGLDDANEFLVAFDDGDFEKIGSVIPTFISALNCTDKSIEQHSWSTTGLATRPSQS